MVEDLKRDLPDLKTFVTLSPAPTLRRWLIGLDTDEASALALTEEERSALQRIDEPGWQEGEDIAALRSALSPLAAYYFLSAKRPDGQPIDPVARFHLGNGARLEQIDWLGDTSPRALSEAAGFMVNYLYDLKDIEDNHELFFNQRRVVASAQVRRLARHQPRAVSA